MTDRKQAQRSRKGSLNTTTAADRHSNGSNTVAGAPRHGSADLHNHHDKHNDIKTSTVNPPQKKQNEEASAADTGSCSSAEPRIVTNAADLTLNQQLAVLDEATELPPFGFNIAGLEKRLQRRLGFEITQSAIKGCLSPYYNLREWGDRYVVTSLGSETEDFPGKGSGNHPPLSPLKEFYLISSEDDDDGDGAGDDDDNDSENEDDDQSTTAGTSSSAEGVGGVPAARRGGWGGSAAASRSRHIRNVSSGHNSRYSSDGDGDGMEDS